jgi:hypothetical protein
MRPLFLLPRVRAWRWLGAFALGCALLAGAAPGASGEAAPVAGLERSVKAAFLYKFLGYIEFPPGTFADASAPFVIGLVGADDMAAELARIVAGRTVNGRPIAVRSLKDNEAPAGVHVLFVAAADTGKLARLQKLVPQQPMLTVTEVENGLALGGVINFRIVDERVRFDVALGAAERDNVKLSSRLLTVAHQVRKGVN